MSKYKVFLLLISCMLLLAVSTSAKYKVEIGNTEVYGGQITTIPITMDIIDPENSQSSLGGFSLYISFNPSVLSFYSASIGNFLDYCDWEYFTYRWVSGVYPACCLNCPSVQVIKLVALAETNNGAYHPSCNIPSDDNNILANLVFHVTWDENAQFKNHPIDFYWIPGEECSSNSFSDMTGDTLILADNVFNLMNNPFDESYNCSGPDPSCFSDIIIPGIDYYSGHIFVKENYETWRGDINLDGEPYQIGDAVTFTNYFIYGLSAFYINVAQQIAATEINCDDITLTVADLVYLIRIIVGDAYPLYNCDDNLKSLTSGQTIALTETSSTDTMAFLGKEGYAGQESCPFEIYAVNSEEIGGLQARIEYDTSILTPSFDEIINDGESVEYQLLGRADRFDEHGAVIVKSTEPGVLLIYMFPDWDNYDYNIPVGSGPILSVNFDVKENIQLFDSSLFAFVTEGVDYNMFSTALGQAIFPQLVNDYFVGYTDLIAFFGAKGYAGQQNVPFEFFVVNTDSVGEVIMDVTFNTHYVNPSLVPNGTVLPWGVGQEVEFELMGRAAGFEDEGSSTVLVGTPETGKLRIWFRPWSDIWYDVTTIEAGVGPIIKVFFDVNPPLIPLRSSPVAFDPNGYNYLNFWDFDILWPTTIDSTFTVIRKPADPSCPVLYTYDGHNFVMDNPLLTACELSGYIETVTDYYHVITPVSSENGQVKFQLREMEDEITYLEDIELITVDHESTTRVACAIDGSIYTYTDVVEPLTAVDHHGIDVLSMVNVLDGNNYISNEPGYLTLTFPINSGKEVGYNISSSLKPICYEPIEPESLYIYKVVPVVDDNKKVSNMKVEFLDYSGNWVASPEIPSREKQTVEVVTCDPSVIGSQDVITMKITWETSYAADIINQFIVADEIPSINTWNINEYNLNTLSTSTAGKSSLTYQDNQTLKMVKGDIFDFSFNCGEPGGVDMTRDYIIKATGRYQPDYDVYDNLVPGGYQLYENYPNPFNPVTNISYDLPEAAYVKLEIFNLLGQQVTTLVDSYQEAGHKQITWNSTNRAGQQVSSGIYLYRLSAGNFTQTKKMVLLK